MPNNTFFARKLKKLMYEHAITQNELASITGVAQTTVSGWLNAGKIPHANMLKIIAKHFNITVSELIGEVKGRPTPATDAKKQLIIENLKYIIHKYDLDDAELAAIAHVTTPRVFDWLTGKRSVAFSEMMRICKHFDIDPNIILEQRLSDIEKRDS